MARARLWQRARLRRRRGRVAHGGRRALLQRRGVRRRIQLSGDLARARLALPLAAHADFGRSGGAGARADRAKAGVGARSHSILSLGFQAEHELAHSAMTIPARSIACHLVNVFGPKTRPYPRRRTSLFRRVPSNWVAKW